MFTRAQIEGHPVETAARDENYQKIVLKFLPEFRLTRSKLWGRVACHTAIFLAEFLGLCAPRRAATCRDAPRRAATHPCVRVTTNSRRAQYACLSSCLQVMSSPCFCSDGVRAHSPSAARVAAVNTAGFQDIAQSSSNCAHNELMAGLAVNIGSKMIWEFSWYKFKAVL
jgi:hypothetical protein